jgi:hypothetical protein
LQKPNIPVAGDDDDDDDDDDEEAADMEGMYILHYTTSFI